MIYSIEKKDKAKYIVVDENGFDMVGDYLSFQDAKMICKEMNEEEAKQLTNFTRIKRTIEALQCCYPLQTIAKETIIKSLNNSDFQAKYINY